MAALGPMSLDAVQVYVPLSAAPKALIVSVLASMVSVPLSASPIGSPLTAQEYKGSGIPLASHMIDNAPPTNPACFNGSSVVMDGASAGVRVREEEGILSHLWNNHEIHCSVIHYKANSGRELPSYHEH